jgi:hypothetical protein
MDWKDRILFIFILVCIYGCGVLAGWAIFG